MKIVWQHLARIYFSIEKTSLHPNCPRGSLGKTQFSLAIVWARLMIKIGSSVDAGQWYIGFNISWRLESNFTLTISTPSNSCSHIRFKMCTKLNSVCIVKWNLRQSWTCITYQFERERNGHKNSTNVAGQFKTSVKMRPPKLNQTLVLIQSLVQIQKFNLWTAILNSSASSGQSSNLVQGL